MLSRGLTSLLDSGKNKAIAAAGPAAAAPAAAAGAATKGGAASLQNAPFATPKHHATEGRNDLQINRKSKFPGGRNVPSEILLEILSNPAIPYPAIPLEIESNPIHPMLTAAASSHALKTAPQRSPSGRFRNSKTPWP